MNNGIKILSERMVSAPSDFKDQKWRKLVVRVLENRGSIFTDEECDLINDSVIELERKLFEGDVLQALAPPVVNIQASQILHSPHVVPYDEDSSHTLSEMVERALMRRLERQVQKAHLLKGKRMKEETECTTA